MKNLIVVSTFIAALAITSTPVFAASFESGPRSAYAGSADLPSSALDDLIADSLAPDADARTTKFAQKTIRPGSSDTNLTLLNDSGYTANYTFTYFLNGIPVFAHGSLLGTQRVGLKIPKDAKNITFRVNPLGRGDFVFNEELEAREVCIRLFGTVFNPKAASSSNCRQFSH